MHATVLQMFSNGLKGIYFNKRAFKMDLRLKNIVFIYINSQNNSKGKNPAVLTRKQKEILCVIVS